MTLMSMCAPGRGASRSAEQTPAQQAQGHAGAIGEERPGQCALAPPNQPKIGRLDQPGEELGGHDLGRVIPRPARIDEDAQSQYGGQRNEAPSAGFTHGAPTAPQPSKPWSRARVLGNEAYPDRIVNRLREREEQKRAQPPERAREQRDGGQERFDSHL